MKLPRPPALSPTQRLLVHPLLGPPEGLDVTQAVTRALAEELWRRFGGNDVLNWVEAERLVREELLALPSARSPAAQRLPPPRAADHFRDEAREPRAGAATHDT